MHGTSLVVVIAHLISRMQSECGGKIGGLGGSSVRIILLIRLTHGVPGHIIKSTMTTDILDFLILHITYLSAGLYSPPRRTEHLTIP